LKITREHLCELFRKDIPWTFSYVPYLELQNFIDLISSISSNDKIAIISNLCVIKFGLHNFYNSIDHDKFSHFYSKCRSASSTCSKLTAIELSQIYRELSSEGKLSVGKLFKSIQPCISSEERVNWITRFRERMNGESNNDFSALQILNLVMN
jgi:hypothetical protein